jgi:hypothetical protein
MTMPGLREKGSVLVEALVASLILAAMLGVMVEAMRIIATQAHAVDARRRAMLVAQSQLAGAGVAGRLVPGVTHGVDGSLDWRMSVEPYAAANAVGAVDRIAVEVRDRSSGQRLATLQTLRLAR